MKKVYRCKNPLCQKQTPGKDMYCGYDCFKTDRDRQIANTPEPTYAPLRVHTGRQPFNRIHSSKVDRS
jgi:hypothetical protein